MVGDCLAGRTALDHCINGQDGRVRRSEFADRPLACGRVVGTGSGSGGGQFQAARQVIGGFDARGIGGADICDGDRVNQRAAHFSGLLANGFGGVKTGFVSNRGGRGRRLC